MHVNISSRNTEVTESLRNVTEEKIGKLERFVDGLDRAEVHFFQEKSRKANEREVCEVNLEGGGHHVRCKVRAPDGFVAVDIAVAKLERQLRKLKTQLVNRYHGGTKHDDKAPSYTPAEAAAIPFAEREPAIVKVKTFDISSMSPAEATVQLDLVDHDFYFFVNEETNRAAVVYRRDDGDFGLIDAAG